MAKLAYKSMYEEIVSENTILRDEIEKLNLQIVEKDSDIQEIETLSTIIKNLENNINEKVATINKLNNKLSKFLKINENQNKLKGVVYRDGAFYKGNKLWQK